MNYIGNHYLNLMGKVVVVTSPSNELGAAICRGLLNSNASVLGIDNRPPHPTTHVGSIAAHFQYMQYRELAQPTSAEVAGYLQGKFGKDEVDFFISVPGSNVKDVSDGTAEFMSKDGTSLRIQIYEEMPDAESLARLAEKWETLSVGTSSRFIAITCDEFDLVDSEGTTMMDPSENAALQRHIADYVLKRDIGGYPVEVERDVANLVLFMCTSQANHLDGILFGRDGKNAKLSQFKVPLDVVSNRGLFEKIS